MNQQLESNKKHYVGHCIKGDFNFGLSETLCQFSAEHFYISFSLQFPTYLPFLLNPTKSSAKSLTICEASVTLE